MDAMDIDSGSLGEISPDEGEIGRQPLVVGALGIETDGQWNGLIEHVLVDRPKMNVDRLLRKSRWKEDHGFVVEIDLVQRVIDGHGCELQLKSIMSNGVEIELGVIAGQLLQVAVLV